MEFRKSTAHLAIVLAAVLLMIEAPAVVHAAECAALSFGPAASFGTGNSPVSVAVGDFNGDAKPDVVAVNQDSNDLAIRLGSGNGAFAPATTFAAGTAPSAVAIGDFNGDSEPDLAVANFSSQDVSILLGNGDGSFGAATSVGAVSTPISIAVGDFNGDGKLDLAVTNYYNAVDVNTPSDVSILLGNGDGTFGAATSFGVGLYPRSVAVGDFNGDHTLDLAVSNVGSRDVSILLGRGDGTFAPATSVGAGPRGRWFVALGDFNGDGRLDLTVANYDAGDVSILLGNGDGSFGAATDFFAASYALSLVLGDFNDDGRLDVAVGDQGRNAVSILLGHGDGTLGAATTFAAGSGPFSVAVGDFNGDGALDVATANHYGNDVSILLNTCACGNGSLDAGEQCDDGNVADGDGCDSNCTLTGCGNGIVTAGEECDGGDCCSATCQLEPAGTPCGAGSICGDGNVTCLPLPAASFLFTPSDASSFDTVQFYNYSYDPAGMVFQPFAWDFGDGTTGRTAADYLPAMHRYTIDGDYTVQLSVATVDGRTASTSQLVHVQTHDVAIVKRSVPRATKAGRTRPIYLRISSTRYTEHVQVELFKSSPAGDGFESVGLLTLSVPARRASRNTLFTFHYKFTTDDAYVGKVTFKAVATIIGARDALPADNEAFTSPTTVRP